MTSQLNVVLIGKLYGPFMCLAYFSTIVILECVYNQAQADVWLTGAGIKCLICWTLDAVAGEVSIWPHITSSFSTIVIPRELYRCKCYLDDDCINLIESFQIYVEQRVQQLFPRTPDVCSFCCIRMDPTQEKMMMMCIRSILMADHQELSREVFCQHTRVFFEISF